MEERGDESEWTGGDGELSGVMTASFCDFFPALFE
jgi:hypothetical protein